MFVVKLIVICCVIKYEANLKEGDATETMCRSQAAYTAEQVYFRKAHPMNVWR